MFWGGEPVVSTAYVFVKVRPKRGWRRLFAYKASDVLPGAGEREAYRRYRAGHGP